MNLYRNKENGRLYMIEHLMLDITKLNNNANAGIYATPLGEGNSIVFKSKNHDKCNSFVKDAFFKVGVYI